MYSHHKSIIQKSITYKTVSYAHFYRIKAFKQYSSFYRRIYFFLKVINIVAPDNNIIMT